MKSRRTDLLGPITFIKVSDGKISDGFAAYETPEGYLAIDGCISGTGVYEYSDAQGNTWGELRAPDEVFAPEALQSFALKPITDDHPDEMVDASNIRQVQCGQLGSDIRPDGDYVRADLLITDPQLISKIKRGKTQLSCGYEVIAVPAEGELDGKSYSSKQTKIQGNHLSVVDEARGGPGCRLLADSISGAGAFSSYRKPQTKDSKVKFQTKDGKIVIGGEELDLPDTVTEHIAMLEAKVEEQGAELSKLSAQGEDMLEEEPPKVEVELSSKDSALDSALEAKVDALQAQLKAMTDGQAAKIDARVALISDAKRILGDGVKLTNASDMAIMRAVVAEALPSMAGKVKDSKSIDYVRAAYEAALDAADRHVDSSSELLDLTGTATLNSDSAKVDLDSLYTTFCDGLKTRVAQEIN